jgi:hypothetical protein
MRAVLALTFAGFLLVPFAAGQKLDLKLDALASKAQEKAEVDLDGAALDMAQKMPGKEKTAIPEQLKGIASALKGVYIRSYEFSKPGEYSDKDLEPLRKQVGDGSGWSRILNVREKLESAEIYTLNAAGQITGLLILACEAAEVSVVHLIGSVKPEQLKDLASANIRYLLPI